LVTASGTVAVQYDYDPYGNSTTVSGSAVSDIGYAGYFYHPASGLEFSLFRAYDPAHARWLNRDPIGEAGGINLYAYVAGDPLATIDPLGYCGFVDEVLNFFDVTHLQFWKETLIMKPIEYAAIQLAKSMASAEVAAGIDATVESGGLAAIPVMEAAAINSMMNNWVQESTNNLPVNMNSGPGVDMGGGIIWQEEQYQ
jgi:RHS repeat-associated protein